MLKRVPIAWDAQRGYHIDVPTYQMLAGTWLPIVKGMLHRDGAHPDANPADVLQQSPTVIALLPDDLELTPQGQIDKMHVARKYAGHGRFDHPDYTPPTISDFHPLELSPAKAPTMFERLQNLMRAGKH